MQEKPVFVRSMNTSSPLQSHFRFGFIPLLAIAVVGLPLVASVGFAAPAKKPVVRPKPAAKPTPKPGIKHTPQMNGAEGRFGDLYALKSGWTFQLLGARYSYDDFDNYGQLYPENGKKLLILKVAIKNNLPTDLYFDGNAHQFQVQDSNNQLYDGGDYRLASLGHNECSLTLKPGQGAGQDPNNALEVALPVADGAKITKIVFKQGRKGTSEDVMRFFVAGTQGGDPKNAIAPVANEGAGPFAPTGFFPSSYYAFRINGVTFSPGPVAGSDAPDNRRFALVNLTVKNMTSKPQSVFDFAAGTFSFTDADGDSYPASGDFGLLKASSDERVEGEFAPGQEKNVRLAFLVPKTGSFKTLMMGAASGKQWTFDASGWK